MFEFDISYYYQECLVIVIFIILVINCHQSLLLYRNFRNINRLKSHNTDIISDPNSNNEPSDSNENTIDGDNIDTIKQHKPIPDYHQHTTPATPEEALKLNDNKENTSSSTPQQQVPTDFTPSSNSPSGDSLKQKIIVDVPISIKSNKQAKIDKQNEFSNEYKEKLTRAIQQILVPCFATLMITIFSYLLIGKDILKLKPNSLYSSNLNKIQLVLLLTLLLLLVLLQL